MRIEYTYQGLDFADNYVHNNTNYGLYTYYSANSNARSNPFTIENNRFVDNQYGVYKSDTSSSYGYSFHIKDNLFKSSTWDGIFGNYYSREWIIENNTFDGDNDQRYGINFNRYSYKAIIGITLSQTIQLKIFIFIIATVQERMPLNYLVILIHQYIIIMD